jgi:succinate-semialdehyde dehydrogenase / glutarate-semialdehyde dehydrogenase
MSFSARKLTQLHLVHNGSNHHRAWQKCVAIALMSLTKPRVLKADYPMTYTADLALFVDGAWQSGEGRDVQPVVNPATGDAMADLPLATPADLDAALAAADRGFAHWRTVDVDARAAILHKVAGLIRERTESIAVLLTMEQGKPLAEARGELAGAAGMFDYYAEEAKRNHGRVLVRPTGQRSLVIRQPVGPVASFTPWNFPVYLMSKKLAAILAAGCSVIAKPPEETPASTAALMRCVHDAGVPGDVAQIVFGVPDMVSRHLLASPVIRKLSFTGSVPVGRHLMKLAADGLKRVTMELGGHSPVLIFDDCDLEKTLDMVVPQKFRNAGQVCVSPTRFYVQEAVYDRFVAGFAERTRKVKIGNGLDADTAMGPLANPRRPDAIERLVADAKAKGARVIAGGAREDGGYFFQPTLIAQANRLPYGLAAFAFTENGRRANLLGDAIEAGMVGINTFAISVADAPFGGVKDSGFGSEGGPEGLESYMVTKAIHQA